MERWVQERKRAVVQFGKEASKTRDYCVARNATLRAARPDPSLRKERLLQEDKQTATTQCRLRAHQSRLPPHRPPVVPVSPDRRPPLQPCSSITRSLNPCPTG